MNKKELIKVVAGKLDVTQKQVAQVVDAMMEAVADALKQGDEVRLANLGKLFVVERQAREGRNPKTGEPIQIPAKKAVRFKPAKDLKDKVQG